MNPNRGHSHLFPNFWSSWYDILIQYQSGELCTHWMVHACDCCVSHVCQWIVPSVGTFMSCAKCWDEQCFLVLGVRSFDGTHSVKEFSITSTNFPHSLINIFSVVSPIICNCRSIWHSHELVSRENVGRNQSKTSFFQVQLVTCCDLLFFFSKLSYIP